MIAFGPVPSRRLGRSLGINNIPPKYCTYGCVYCQVGRTSHMQAERSNFYRPEAIVQDVLNKCKKAQEQEQTIDYLTFVPDGEPTLDIDLGLEILLLKPLGIKTAVITNSSLLWRADVRAEIKNADLISVKIDTVNNETWHKINRPHGSLNLDDILAGIDELVRDYDGKLITETMLIHGLNDSSKELNKIAGFIAGIKPEKSYLTIPTRPPAEKGIEGPLEIDVIHAFQIFEEHAIPTEYLIGYEGNAFCSTGDVAEDLLRITAVHPMREDAVKELLKRSGAGWKVVQELLRQDKLTKVTYNQKKFFLRTFKFNKG